MITEQLLLCGLLISLNPYDINSIRTYVIGIVTTVAGLEAKLDVASARTFIQWEKIGDGTRQEKGERDLATAGPFSERARTNINARIVQIFSPEKDIDVKITLGAAAGDSRNGNRGGEGGISVFKMTLKQNTEYTVKLGINYFKVVVLEVVLTVVVDWQ